MVSSVVTLFFNLLFIVVLHLCFLQTIKDVAPIEMKSYNCFYNQTIRTFTCNGRNKQHAIPKIPINATNLVIQNGNFGRITKETLHNVAQSFVTSLHLYNCRITSISKDAFENLKRISSLDLSRNYRGLSTQTLAASFHSLARSRIKKLSLNWMGFDNLPKHMFAGLESTNITEIHLNHNLLRYINGEVYRNLKNLRILDLGWNAISDLNNTFNGLSQVTNLTLSGSWFSFFPNFCNKKNESVMPNLQELDLDYTKINSLFAPITCLDSLQKLNVSGLSLRLLYDNTFAYLPSLKELSLRQLGSQLRNIRKAAFNSSSLESLTFSVSGDFAFNKKNIKHFHPKHLFNLTRKLKSLDLSHNRFQLKDKYWREIFKPLTNLRKLKLKDVKMQKLPVDIQNVFPVLVKLDLSSNRITNWEDSKPFLAFKALKRLSLRGNRISIINRTSFPEQWIEGECLLKELHLVNNPFSCTCDLSWFREWMDRTNSLNISTDKDVWRCAITKHKVLDYYPWNTFQCLVQYIVSSLVGLFIILATVFICYVFRFRIKLWLYRCSSKRNDYQLISDRPCKYDVFVAYAYADLHFVQNQLIPKMEDEYNRQLCIRDRDFELGTVFSSHIAENIEASRTVLLLLSSNFAKDSWCKFQLDVANHLRIQFGLLTIIPILLENIRFKFMNETIFQMMSSMDYLTWSDDDSAQELFWQAMQDKIPVGDNEDLSLNCSVQMYDALQDNNVHLSIN